MLSLQSALDFVLEATWQAGRNTLRYYQTGIRAERKADNSPVTIADRETEQMLRGLIKRYYPDHNIIGEEYGEQSANGSPYTWIIDPIDGTKSFIHGVPFYSVLLALTEGDHSLVGAIHLPALGETVYAARGLGCFQNGRRVHVSTVDTLKEATLLSSEIVMREEQNAAWHQLLHSTYIQRTWGDAYGYAMVATGRAEIMLDPAMHVWDCAPLPVILEEAGGTFTNWQGESTIYAKDSVATNGVLRDAVLNLMKMKNRP